MTEKKHCLSLMADGEAVLNNGTSSYETPRSLAVLAHTKAGPSNSNPPSSSGEGSATFAGLESYVRSYKQGGYTYDYDFHAPIEEIVISNGQVRKIKIGGYIFRPCKNTKTDKPLHRYEAGEWVKGYATANVQNLKSKWIQTINQVNPKEGGTP